MTTKPETIDVAIAQQMLLAGRAVIVDTRPKRAYEAAEERIPSALRIEPGSGMHMDQALEHIPRERLIITYCDEPGHAASAQVARRARELGRGDAVYLDGGFAAWVEAGLPTEPRPDAVGESVPIDLGAPVEPL